MAINPPSGPPEGPASSSGRRRAASASSAGAARGDAGDGAPRIARLMHAISRNDTVACSSVLAAAPELLQKDSQDEVAYAGGMWTPLGLACRLGQVDVVRMLLSRGADKAALCSGYSPSSSADAKRADACPFGSPGFSPIHLAAMGKHARVVKVLLEAGADPTVRDRSNNTPLYMAARALSPECVHALLEASEEARLSVAVENDASETPMMAALMALHSMCSPAEGQSAAQTCATIASISLVMALLLQAGADANDSSMAVGGKPVKFSSALMASLQHGLNDLTELLLLHGAELPPGTPLE